MGRYDKDWSWKPTEQEIASCKAKVKRRKKQGKQGRSWKQGFYNSWEWKKLRYEVLKHYGAQCMVCNSTWNLVVDHIKPRSKFPELALDPDNLQVLCVSCNRGKSNDDYTDFRPKLPQPELEGEALEHMRTLQ